MKLVKNNNKLKNSENFHFKKEIPENTDVFFMECLSEKITDGAHYSPEKQEKGFLFKNVSNMKNGQLSEYPEYYITKEEFDKLSNQNCQPLNGDVLFSKDGTVGKVIYVRKDEECVLLSSIAIIRINNENINNEYISHLLKSKKTQAITKAYMSGSALKRLTLKDLKKVPVLIHKDIKQQEKIATVLSRQEEQVNKIKTLIEKLEKRNQYYAERLLSGELRVREGECGEVEFYKNKKYKDCYINGVKKSIPEDAQITTLRKNYKDLNEKGKEGLNGYLEIGDIDVSTKLYDLSDKDKLSVSSCKIVPKNTLLISTVRPTRRCFTITKDETVVSTAFVRFYIEEDKYPLHIINTIDFSTFCERFSEGGTYPVIKSDNVENYEYLNLPEKKLISDILDSLIEEKNKLIYLLKKEEERFNWMSDALLSGDYQVQD